MCNCGFWVDLLGYDHQDGACNLLMDTEVDLVFSTYDSRTNTYPGEGAFDEWVAAHRGPAGLLVFSDAELAPYRD